MIASPVLVSETQLYYFRTIDVLLTFLDLELRLVLDLVPLPRKLVEQFNHGVGEDRPHGHGVNSYSYIVGDDSICKGRGFVALC